MAATKFSVTLLLLLSGMVLYGGFEKSVIGARACPEYCLDVEYMTCKSSGDQKLSPRCNCCMAPKKSNCTLHLSDGSQVSCP